MADLPLSETLDDEAWFAAFAQSEGLRLRQGLLARFGVEVGCEVWEDALAWAWEHRDRVKVAANPVGYLYRVAQSASRPYVRWSPAGWSLSHPTKRSWLPIACDRLRPRECFGIITPRSASGGHVGPCVWLVVFRGR